MVRSIVSLGYSNKKKAARVLAPSENSAPLPARRAKNGRKGSEENLAMGDKIQSRRRKNHALTEKEFSGCILCYLTCPRPPVAQSPRKDKSSNNGSSNGNRSCIYCVSKGRNGGCTNGRISPLPALPEPLMPYRKDITELTKKVQFSDDTMQAASGERKLARRKRRSTLPENAPKKNEVEHTADDERTLPDTQEGRLQSDLQASPQDNKLSDCKDSQPEAIQQHEQEDDGQESPWDDLLRSLKKGRRRSHNFALSSAEFESTIFPSLRTALQQTSTPSA